MFKFLFLIATQVTCMVLNPLNMEKFDWMTNRFNTPNAARVINPINDVPSNRSIIFFPATTVNRLPPEMYNDFLYSLAEKNMEIYVPKKNAIDGIIDDIKDRNMDITLVAHSTAAIDAIRSCQSTDIVDNLILIDPLDTRGLNKNDDNPLFLNTVDKLVIVNSEKSNDWRLVPVIMPIGVFSLDTNMIKLGDDVDKQVLKSEIFGHFDILDNTWADIIHNTISKGSEDRNPLKLYKYRRWIADTIDTVTSNNAEYLALDSESYVSKNYY
jgi:hypothetical protein